MNFKYSQFWDIQIRMTIKVNAKTNKARDK